MRGLLALAAVGSCALGACAGSPDVSGEGPAMEPVVALDEVPARFTAAYCALVERCWGEVLLEQAFPGESCETRLRKGFEQSDFVALKSGVDAGRISYHPEQLEACEEAVAAARCDGVAEVQDLCRSVFEGSVDLGGACQSSADCKGDALCAFEGACPGTCSPKIGENGVCADDGECAEGLRCDYAAAGPDLVCRRAALEGESCGGPDASPCAEFLFCDIGDGTTPTGTCRQVGTLTGAELGQSCDQDPASLCKPGLVCAVEGVVGESIAMTCKAPQATSGGPCTLAIPNDCPAGEFCPLTLEDYRAGMLQANCLPLPAAGEPCTTGPKSGVCGPDLLCEGQFCVARKNLGEPCVSPELCYSGHCTGGICAAAEFCH